MIGYQYIVINRMFMVIYNDFVETFGKFHKFKIRS